MVDVVVGEPLGVGNGHISAGNLGYNEAVEFAGKIKDKYLVKVSPDAPGCCIDGRCALHTMAGPESRPEPRPSVSGGPLFTAFGAAEMVPGFYGDKSAQTSLGRLDEVKGLLEARGIKLGGHVTNAAAQNGFKNPKTGASQTGCGLNDEFKQVMTKPATEKKFVDDTTALLMGEQFNPAAMTFRGEDEITTRIADYDSRKALDVLLGEEGGNAEGVEVLDGQHGEILVVFNYVEGTTVDRDRLVQETGKQVFVVDMWYIKKLAAAMAAGRPDAEEMSVKLEHAMVAFQVATYPALCDGTHRPVILKPQEAAVPASL